MIAATIVCALACAALVAAEYKHWRIVRAVAKAFASGGFVTLALLTLTTCDRLLPPWSEYQLYMIVGLVLGMAGDIALLGKSEGAFLAGLTAFLLGHIAYIVGFAQLAPPSTWLDVRALIPLVVGGTALRLLWSRLGSMRVPVIAYVIAIVLMMSAALAASRMPAIALQNRVLLVVGAALFFLSDLAVAKEKFVAASFATRAWGLPAYFAGQLLIAWSLLPAACP